ncbi:MAG: Uma2 family endonuclease [Defluviitaleaceae bacterium]|nr:Uma2 family endonuclease [Defluviitaleaceae bacterium]
MENPAYRLNEYPNGYQDERPTELVNGTIITMAPPVTNHTRVLINITVAFGNYLKGKPCEQLIETNLHLSKNDRLRPDHMIICKPDIIKANGVHGTPDLIVEILSPSTKARDRGYKKNLYEQCGVREYWIVDVTSRSIEVYLLAGSKLELAQVYEIYPEYMLENMPDEEVAAIPLEFKTSLFNDLVINLEDVFRGVQ